MMRHAALLLSSCAAAAAAVATSLAAQEPTAGRVAPPAVYEVAPALGTYTDDVLFGAVWSDATLSPRDRSLITVSALISMGRTAQVGGHVARAFDNGVTPEEVAEVVAHLAFYAGWPNAISAVPEIEAVLAERGLEVSLDETAPPLQPDAAAEAARAAQIAATIAPVAPALAEATDQVLFADLWLRPDFAPRDRSLVTVAALVATGQAEQLPFHLNRAMDSGLTREEASEMLHHLAYYAGWPRAMSAVPVVEAVFIDRDAEANEAAREVEPAAVTVTRGESATTEPGPASNFTGSVRIGPSLSTEAPARVGGALVAFEAGARTNWHIHPLGQTLYVTDGCGWVQSEGREVQAIGPGDIVQILPDVRHWHGASASEGMTHLAVAEALDGTAVTWMEPVADEDYAQGVEAEAACRADD